PSTRSAASSSGSSRSSCARRSCPCTRLCPGELLKLVSGACHNLFPDVCPKDATGALKFSALPPRDRWLERVLACRAPPGLDESIQRNAVLAQRRILRTAAEMRRDVAVSARDLADRYLARYGLDYDAWMA